MRPLRRTAVALGLGLTLALAPVSSAMASTDDSGLLGGDGLLGTGLLGGDTDLLSGDDINLELVLEDVELLGLDLDELDLLDDGVLGPDEGDNDDDEILDLELGQLLDNVLRVVEELLDELLGDGLLGDGLLGDGLLGDDDSEDDDGTLGGTLGGEDGDGLLGTGLLD